MAISKVIINNQTLMDVTDDTVNANSLLRTYQATAANGEKVQGNSIDSVSAYNAILFLTTPAGNTATISRSGTTLLPVMWVWESDNTIQTAMFVIDSLLFDSNNPWTIEITNGNQQATATVIIDDNKAYHVKLGYRVPFEYQAVEYVRNNGSGQCVILTLDVPNRMRDMTVDFYFKAITPWANYMIGNAVTPYFTVYVNDTQRYLYFRASTNSDYTSYDCGTGNLGNAKRRLQYSDGNFYYEGALVKTYSYTGDIKSNFGLFGLPQSSATPYYSNVQASFAAYGLKVSLGRTKYDLRPCYRKSDGVIGFWDEENREFRPSDGTVPFYLVGPDILE